MSREAVRFVIYGEIPPEEIEARDPKARQPAALGEELRARLEEIADVGEVWIGGSRVFPPIR